jgi:hypothetical protein
METKLMELLSIVISGLAAALVIGLGIRVELARRRQVLKCERRTRLLLEAIRQGI